MTDTAQPATESMVELVLRHPTGRQRFGLSWAEARALIEEVEAEAVRRDREALVERVAAYVHGYDCTCPFSVEPADIVVARRLLGLQPDAAPGAGKP